MELTPLKCYLLIAAMMCVTAIYITVAVIEGKDGVLAVGVSNFILVLLALGGLKGDEKDREETKEETI